MLKPTPNLTSERVYGLLLGAIYGEWRGRYPLSSTASTTTTQLSPQASQIWPHLNEAIAAVNSLVEVPALPQLRPTRTEPLGQDNPLTTAEFGAILPALVLCVDQWEIQHPRLIEYCTALQADELTTTLIQAIGIILNAILQPDAPTVLTKAQLQSILATQLAHEPMRASAADVLTDLQQIQTLDTLWLLQHSGIFKAASSPWQRDFYLAYYALTAAPLSIETAIQVIEAGLGQLRPNKPMPIANTLVGAWLGAIHGPKVISDVWQICLTKTWQNAIAAAAQRLVNLWSGHLYPNH